MQPKRYQCVTGGKYTLLVSHADHCSFVQVFLKGRRVSHGSLSQAPSHYDYIFWKALHFGYFEAAKFAIEVHHLFVYLPNLTKGTMRA